MSNNANLVLLLTALTGAAAQAAPVELDTPDAHIIVVRPVDLWSGDSSAQSDSLEHVRSKTANYWVWLGYKDEVNGGPLLLQRASTRPVVVAATAEMAKDGFAPSYSQSYGFKVLHPEPLAPATYEELSQAQAALYKLTILNQGDPDTLQNRTSGKKFVGTLLTLATLGIAGGKFGAIGAETVINTGLAGDIYRLPSSLRESLALAILPPLDSPSFKEIEVRSVSYRGGMNGQIVIAYRSAKTEEAEVEAMGVAIAAVAGAGTTVEGVEKSRADDLAFRKATWDACVIAGDCKDGVYAPQQGK